MGFDVRDVLRDGRRSSNNPPGVALLEVWLYASATEVRQ